MEIDAAFSSMFISPDTGGRATSIGGGLGSEGPIPEVEVDASFASMSISHGPAQPEPRPVHRLINIRENDGVEYGLGDFDSALLALRPNLNPGTQVVQLTITSSCLLESTHDLSVVQEEVASALPTLRSVVVKEATGGIAKGIIRSLVPNAYAGWRVAPNLVVLHLNGVVVKRETGNYPVRTIGRAMKQSNQLPAIQELVFLNCPALKNDVKPLADALRKGNAAQLRVLSWDNSSGGSPEPSTYLLLGALAFGKCRRPRLEALTFADGPSAVETPLPDLGATLKACSGLRRLVLDCSSFWASELKHLSQAITKGDCPSLEFVSLTIFEASSTEESQNAIEALTRATQGKIQMEVKHG